MKKQSVKLIKHLTKKALKSHCTYKVSAVAFDNKGNVLGSIANKHSKWDVLEKEHAGRAGTAEHPERMLIARYGKNVKTLVICRVGRAGELRPIDPCPACAKVAKKYGVKILSVYPGCNN